MGTRPLDSLPQIVRLDEAAGVEVEVQVVAAPGHPRRSIVLLHEALGSVSHWRDFPQRLAARCSAQVLVYSRTGHGNSPGPPQARSRQYFQAQSTTVLPALMARYRIEQPVLLGHSEGAAIALLYAAHHPQAVRALVLESPILVMEKAAAEGMALAEQAYHSTDLRERLGRHHQDADAVFAAWLTIRESDTLLDRPLRQHLAPLPLPVLLLQGERDEYATGLQAEELRSVAPNLVTALLPETGHTPHREQPEAILERIAAFLDSLPEADSGT